MDLSGLTNHGPKFVTTCRLCFKQIERRPALNVPIIGRPPAACEDLVKKCLGHLSKHHPEDLQRGIAVSAEFSPWLIMSAFQFEDPTLPARLELIRSQIFAKVRKNTISDDSLTHIVSTWGLDPDDATKVLEGFKALPDSLCEVGQFSPKAPAAPRVV